MLEKELLFNLLSHADMEDEGNQRTIKILYLIALKRIKMTDRKQEPDTQLEDITELYNSLDDRKRRLLYVFARGLSDKN